MSASPICELDDIRAVLRDLESLLGLQGSFRPVNHKQIAELDSPEQLQELFTELLVGVFGMDVRGL